MFFQYYSIGHESLQDGFIRKVFLNKKLWNSNSKKVTTFKYIYIYHGMRLYYLNFLKLSEY